MADMHMAARNMGQVPGQMKADSILCSLKMQNDTHDVQYHSNCLSLHHSICCCYCSLSPVDCGMPNRPVNGSIRTSQSTLGGSVVEFGCAPGFIPSERMMATCALNGTWSPDPGTLMCSGERNANKFVELHIHVCTSSM